MGVFSLSTSGGEGWGEEAVSLILKATLNKPRAIGTARAGRKALLCLA